MNSYIQHTEAPLFVIDHTWVPPPTKTQLLQEEQLEKQKNSQLFLEYPLPIWHKDTFIPVRLF